MTRVEPRSLDTTSGDCLGAERDQRRRPRSNVRDIMERLRTIVEGTDTPAGRTFDLVVQALILASLATFTLETIPGLSAQTKYVLDVVEVVAVVLFSLEYALRVTVSRPVWKYSLSGFGLIDLAAILPFYLRLGIDLRSVRVLRVLRLFRILKLVRYSKAIANVRAALKSVRSELVVFMVATVLVLYIAAVGIYYCEHEAQPKAFASIPHCLWWAVATMTTVGYGDVYPITPAGRIFTFLILMLGLGVVAVPTGLVSSALTRGKVGGADVDAGEGESRDNR
ncbi:MAG: ion transporter [Myxococcales bacterium]|nr:ion transporter [Myxococcales bacterium]